MLELLSAAAEGHARAEMTKALTSLGVSRQKYKTDEEFVSRGSIALLKAIKQLVSINSLPSTESEFWIDGVWLMVLTNYFSFHYEASFEVTSTSALVFHGGQSRTDEIAEIVASYNQMTDEDSKALRAIGQTCAKWANAPEHQNLLKLSQLYEIVTESLSENERHS